MPGYRSAIFVAGVVMTAAAVPFVRVHTHDAQKQSLPPHVGRHMAAAHQPLLEVEEPPDAVVARQLDEMAAAEAARREAEANAERERQAAAEAAERLAATVQAAAQPVARSGTGTATAPSGDVAAFLACTRAHESDTAGGYAAVSPGGTYRGAYQFDAQTWRSSAIGAGFGEWANTPVDQVPPGVQDAVAAWLYAQAGNRPWGGRC